MTTGSLPFESETTTRKAAIPQCPNLFVLAAWFAYSALVTAARF